MKKQFKDVFDSSWVSEVLEINISGLGCDVWPLRWGGIHWFAPPPKVPKSEVFFEGGEGGGKKNKTSMKFNYPACLFVCLLVLFCLGRFFHGVDPMVKSTWKKHHLFRRKNLRWRGKNAKTTLGHDLEGCKAEPKKVEKINNLLFESSGWKM